MYKLLIVDDQQSELQSILDLYDWHELGLEIVGTALDGREALDMAVQLRPDIVISDVAMPRMDGLSLMGELRKALPRTRVICISCFDDFKFTKAAIDHHAFAYCLKPIIASELQETLRRAIHEIEVEAQEKKLVVKADPAAEVFWRELIWDSFDRKQVAMQAAYLGIRYHAFGYTVIEARLNPAVRGISPPSRLLSNFLDAARQTEAVVLPMDMRHVLLIFVHDLEDEEDVGAVLGKLLADMRALPGEVTFGVGSMAVRLEDLHSAYRSAHEAQHRERPEEAQALDGNERAARKMLAYINRSYKNPIQLEDVARGVHLSANYANLTFKQVYGKTIHQAIEERRLEKAVELLRDQPELHIYEIAEMAGFSNSTYFSKVFRKNYGCTPVSFQQDEQ